MILLRISETFLDFSFESDYESLMLEDCNSIRSDHASNTQKGWCLYLL